MGVELGVDLGGRVGGRVGGRFGGSSGGSFASALFFRTIVAKSHFFLHFFTRSCIGTFFPKKCNHDSAASFLTSQISSASVA